MVQSYNERSISVKERDLSLLKIQKRRSEPQQLSLWREHVINVAGWSRPIS